ncbi:helix-turn-helix domain-containing protein [Clostridiaceae bacterium HSG29]|nr:helix-turn-helix domain-containing protein [Clostridiaceae bacterium HSG29]
MGLTQIKNIFSKIASSINNDIVLTDLNGVIIDCNRTELNGSIVKIPEFIEGKEIFSEENYDFIFIKQYNFPRYLLGIKDNIQMLNVVSLLFNDKNYKMTEANFYRELVLNNIKKENYDELKKEFKIEDRNYYRLIIAKVENSEIKNAKYIIDNIFIFDKNIILDSESIAIITSKPDVEIENLCNMLFIEFSTDISKNIKLLVGSKVDELYDINSSLKDIYNILKLIEKFNIVKDIYFYEDFLIPLLIGSTRKDLLIQLNDENNKKYDKIFKNKDLIYTAKNFFKNNLNITETSEKIFVHRNTLIYRINKIKEISGFDLKLFEDAMRFYIILLIKDMDEK